MKYKGYKTILLPVLLVFLALLSGCTTDYDREDIYDYVEEKYALKDVEVSEARAEYTDEEGYRDYIWEVSADGINFRVLDNYHWGMEALTNTLADDYKNVMLKKYYNPKILHHFTLGEAEEQRLYSNWLEGNFHTKEELIGLYEELENFRTYVEKRGYTVPNSFYYHLQMQTPIRDKIQGIVMDDGDSYGMVTDIGKDTIEEAIARYIRTYVDYRFNDLSEKITEEEMIKAVSDSDHQIAIRKEEQADFYEDLCASPYGYGISYGTLYEILKREGFDVSGDPEHYSFVGTNQDTYEISYDFTNADGENDESGHYYYLKNGAPVQMEYDFYNHFTVSKIEEMSGLKLYIGTPEEYGFKKNEE